MRFSHAGGKDKRQRGLTVKERDLIVIGGGPAGLAAALEAYNRGVRDIVIIERDRELGGILQQCIHNGFGIHIFNEELTGPEYADRFIKQVLQAHIDFRLSTMVLGISGEREVTIVNSEEGVVTLRAKAIVLAMGCRERTRGALNIPGTRPAGIFTAGTAQRLVNMEGYLPGRKVVILGSGDIGLIMARRMTLEGAEVKMVCELMPYSSGLTRNIVQCLNDFNIPLVLNHTVVNIFGEDRLTGVMIAEVDENRRPISETEQYVACDTLLLSVGLIPENELSRSAGIEIDPATLGPRVNESMETTIDGIFACGNVVQVHDLVDNVTKESITAGRNAARYVRGETDSTGEGDIIQTTAGNNVAYVVPQRIRKAYVEEESRLSFRVKKVFKQAEVRFTSGDAVVYSKKVNRAVPGEMVSIPISKEMLAKAVGGALVVSVEPAV